MGNLRSKRAATKVQAEPEPAVGAQLLQNSEVDASDVPAERAPMVAMEILAGRKTQYRRRSPQYKGPGSLEYSQDPELYAIRNLLDEPIGRYYASEHCISKNLDTEKQLMDFWVSVHFLKNPEVALEEVLKRRRGKPSDESRASVVTTEDTTQAGKSEQMSDKEKVLKRAKDLVDQYLTSDAEKRLDAAIVDEDLIAKTLEAAQESLKNEDVETLASSVFVEIQEAVILHLVKLGFYSRFKKHSEFKRYELKFKSVYNSVSHKDFDYLRILGRGSFGKVIQVRTKVTGTVYALKVISKKKLLDNSESSSHVMIERNVLLVCNHPNIVKMHFCFQTSRALFLVLECLPGGTLAQAAQNSGGKLPIDAVRFQAAQIVLALDHLHMHGVIYRDLKPENVMLDSHGNAILTDMGLCVKVAPSKDPDQNSNTAKMPIVNPEELRCAGTLNFRAPEVLKSKSTKKGYGAASDYFSLGVTIYVLVTGAFPFRAKPFWPMALLFFGNDMKAEEISNQNNPPKYEEEIGDKDLISCLKGLLALDAKSRLGADVEELKKHSFFDRIDWKELEAGKSSPVYQPKIKNHPPNQKPGYTNLNHVLSSFPFDNMLEAFAGEVEGKSDFQHVRSRHQKLFRMWDYIADEVLEDIWRRVETGPENLLQPSTPSVPPDSSPAEPVGEGKSTPKPAE